MSNTLRPNAGNELEILSYFTTGITKKNQLRDRAATLGLLRFPVKLKKKIIVGGWPGGGTGLTRWGFVEVYGGRAQEVIEFARGLLYTIKGKMSTRKSRHKCCLLFLHTEPNANAVSIVFSIYNHHRPLDNHIALASEIRLVLLLFFFYTPPTTKKKLI